MDWVAKTSNYVRSSTFVTGKQQESSAAKHKGMIEGFAMRLQTLAAKEPQKFYEREIL